MPGNIYTTKLLDVYMHEPQTSFEPVEWVIIVMDYVKSDLRTVLSQARIVKLSEGHVVTILFNMLCALDFLHSTNLMHRDIKPANFLIDDEC